jgi:rubredoxin
LVKLTAMTAVCSMCGRVADPEEDGDPPLGWCADLVETSEGQRTHWVCPSCTRKFVRAIEAKLEQQWW